jgi:hypothetical protein
MELRRIYADGSLLGADSAPLCTGVDLFHTGTSAEQTFKRSLVLSACAQGWMSVAGDTLELKAKQDTLTYSIVRHPGYYVRSTGERIPLSELAMSQYMTEIVATLAPAEARAFLSGRGLEPDDYEATRNYHCVLNDEQHAKWRAVRDAASNVVAAHTLEA